MRSSSSLRGKRKAKTISRIYEHWSDEETPFVKGTHDVPSESHEEKSGDALSDEHDFTGIQSFYNYDKKAMNSEDRSIVCLNIPVRSAWIAVGIFSTLLVTISVTLAVLIMGS